MNRKVLFSSVICILVLLSCKKNESFESYFTPDKLNLIAEDVQITHFIDQIMSTVDLYSAVDESVILKSASIDGGCAIITRSNVQKLPFPIAVTIDFGAGCKGADGKIRSGKINVLKSAPWKEAEARRTVTFDNYFVDGAKIEGTQSVSNDGLIDGNQTFTWKGNITLTKADQTSVTRNETRTRAYLAGFYTPGVLTDDVIQLTGSSWVTKSDHSAYGRTILVPLIRKGDCDFITSGIIEFSKSETDKFTMDYGNGDCDNKATIRRGTKIREIILKK